MTSLERAAIVLGRSRAVFLCYKSLIQTAPITLVNATQSDRLFDKNWATPVQILRTRTLRPIAAQECWQATFNICKLCNIYES